MEAGEARRSATRLQQRTPAAAGTRAGLRLLPSARTLAVEARVGAPVEALVRGVDVAGDLDVVIDEAFFQGLGVVVVGLRGVGHHRVGRRVLPLCSRRRIKGSGADTWLVSLGWSGLAGRLGAPRR